MRASLIAYWAPKEGSSAAEYEDAWRVHPGPADEVPGSWVAVAVADGATESLLARYWAAMVVDEFAVARSSACDARSFAETALALSDRWPDVVESYMAEREKAARPLRWYERPGIEKGAFATLLTLQMNIDTRLEDDAEPRDNAEPHDDTERRATMQSRTRTQSRTTMQSRTTTQSRTTMQSRTRTQSRTWIPAHRVSSVTGDPRRLAIRVSSTYVTDGSRPPSR